MKKILLISGNKLTSNGGIQTYRKYLIKIFQNENIKVDYLYKDKIEIKEYENVKFINKDVYIKVINNNTKFSNKYKNNQILKINIAHNEGNYFTDPNHLDELNKEGLIAFKYCDEKGNINNDTNPNGSLENIAGILNLKKNILGMMPHPERMIDEITSNKDGINLFSSLLN